jgi:hypothetical protein
MVYRSCSVVKIVKSRQFLWAGHVAWMGRQEACRIFVGKLLGRPKSKWEDNIRLLLGKFVIRVGGRQNGFRIVFGGVL